MPKPAPSVGPSDSQIFRRALGVGVLGLGIVALAVGADGGRVSRAAAFFKSFVAPTAAAHGASAKATHLFPEPLSDELRRKGFHECYPHDPIGLGPYTPFKNVALGRMTVPQVGGHTADMGFDVVIQFHGHSPVRKTLVQVARGVAFVGIDRGVGSGRYSEVFTRPDVYPGLLRSIEAGLKRQTGDERAHIRHVALSAWSAGYGAINEILKHGDEKVDAVVLLDGLHAAWKPGTSARARGNVSSMSSLPLSPSFRFAKKAVAGEKIFVFTHSEVEPVEGYPGTEKTADLLLHELGLERRFMEPGDERFGQISAVDEKGLHVWGFRGGNEGAHCSHISHITRALHLIEDAWETPPMDRNVPNTPAPPIGKPTSGIELEGVADSVPAVPDEESLGAAVGASLEAAEVKAPAAAKPAPVEEARE